METMNEGAGNRSMLDWALWYLRKGFCVIPCHPKTKEPIPKWREYGKERPTEKQVRAWWTENTDANIAIILGQVSNLITLEIDDPGILGEHEIPRTPQAISGGKRLPHIYFRYVEGMRNHKEPEKERGTGKGEKFSIRGDGQYIIVPPSTHPKGGRYEWGKGLGIHEVEIVDPPDWVLELIKENPAKEEAESFFKKKDSNFEDGLRKYVEELKSKVRLSDLLMHLGVERTESNSRYIQFNCPFHNSEGKKSFTAWDEIGVGKDWHDEKNYDCIGFVEAHQNLGFIDALNFLAEYAGLEHYRPKISVTDDVKEEHHGLTDREMIPRAEFPFEVFDSKTRKVIDRISTSIQVEPELVASTALNFISGAIGNTVRVCPKEGHVVPLFLWLIVIAESGYGKSPAQDALFDYIAVKQAEKYKTFNDEMRAYNKTLRVAKGDPSLDVPDKPRLEHLYASDATVEALADALESTPRGLVVYRDEISGLILGLNQYKHSGKGNDRQHYIELFDCRPLKIDRKTGPTIVLNPGAAITGGIQPRIMPAIFSQESFDDGLLPRFLFINSENKNVEYDERGIEEKFIKHWNSILEKCYQLPLTVKDTGYVKPRVIGLDKDAKALWKEFFNEYAQLRPFLSERARVFIPKLMTYGYKFMGILHILDELTTTKVNKVNEVNVTLSSNLVEQAIKLVRFFTYQVVNVLDLYKPKENQLTEHELRLIRTLDILKGSISDGQLLFSKIVETYNKNLPQNLQLTSKKLGLMTTRGLGLLTKNGAQNKTYLVWETSKISKLLSRLTLTLLTSLTLGGQ